MRQNGNVAAAVGQFVEGRKWNEHVVANAAHIDSDLRGQRLDEFAAEKSNHAWRNKSLDPFGCIEIIT